MSQIKELWLLSTPIKDVNPIKEFNNFNANTLAKGFSKFNAILELPTFRVRSMDECINAIDDLDVLIPRAQEILGKIFDVLSEKFADLSAKMEESLRVKNLYRVFYVTSFQWDSEKYPIEQPIGRHIAEISKVIKEKYAEFGLQERKNSFGCDFVDLFAAVESRHLVLDSRFLITLLVLVPKIHVERWLSCYEKLTDLVVPRSSEMIAENVNYCLFNVTLFQQSVSEFKNCAARRGFFVRDCVDGRNLSAQRKKEFKPFLTNLQQNFSEIYCLWIHLKVLRVFVESVLRYGLSEKKLFILTVPNEKKIGKFQKYLTKLYDNLGCGYRTRDWLKKINVRGFDFIKTEYYPYAWERIPIEDLRMDELSEKRK